MFVERYAQLSSALHQRSMDPIDVMLSQVGQLLGKYPMKQYHVTTQRLSPNVGMLLLVMGQSSHPQERKPLG